MGRSRLQVLKISLGLLVALAAFNYLFTTLFGGRGNAATGAGRPDVEPAISPLRRGPSVEATELSVRHLSIQSLEEMKELLTEGIHVAMIFTKANESVSLRRKFELCVSSMLEFATSDINLHIIGDYHSLILAEDIVTELRKDNSTAVEIKILMYDAEEVARLTEPLVSSIKRHFIYKPGAYYSDALFFFSIAMHRVFPLLDRVLLLDVDLRFRSDVAQLYAHFDRFAPGQVIGLAREQQPVYRHVFHLYRRDNPGTDVGDPPPEGRTGFNSAVLLLHLSRMRDSADYARVLNATAVTDSVDRYRFQGHLGDQDVFTLTYLDQPELFYVLPCVWNRQLCQWWRYHGYEDVFDSYHACDGDVKILHGNCNTPIPEE